MKFFQGSVVLPEKKFKKVLGIQIKTKLDNLEYLVQVLYFNVFEETQRVRERKGERERKKREREKERER